MYDYMYFWKYQKNYFTWVICLGLTVLNVPCTLQPPFWWKRWDGKTDGRMIVTRVDEDVSVLLAP